MIFLSYGRQYTVYSILHDAWYYHRALLSIGLLSASSQSPLQVLHEVPPHFRGALALLEMNTHAVQVTGGDYRAQWQIRLCQVPSTAESVGISLGRWAPTAVYSAICIISGSNFLRIRQG